MKTVEIFADVVVNVSSDEAIALFALSDLELAMVGGGVGETVAH